MCETTNEDFAKELKSLLADIKKCTICLPHLEHGVNPVMTASPECKIAIIGQAPGRVVHQTGIPWDDQSGERLRDWLGVSHIEFYNESLFALLPMGFCYPGKGKSGDLPPRPECAPQWHQPVLHHMKDLQLVLLIGNYAMSYYLQGKRKRTLTETVKNYREYLPQFFPLPHPSPRNNIWLKRNPWFTKELIPHLRKRVHKISRLSI